MIKLLNEEYLYYCLDVAASETRVSGTTPLSGEAQKENFKKFFTDVDKYSVIGYFDNEKLVSWIILGFYDTEKYGKFWVITNLFSTNKREFFNFVNPEISELMRAAFMQAEERGFFKYFYCVSERISKVYEKQWGKRNPLNYHGVYKLEDVAVIPANTVPESELFWGLMGREIRPHDMYIKARIKR